MLIYDFDNQTVSYNDNKNDVILVLTYFVLILYLLLLLSPRQRHARCIYEVISMVPIVR